MTRTSILLFALCCSLLSFAESADQPAPSVDRVGFPEGYSTKYQVLRTVFRNEQQKVVTIYGNDPAASVTNAAQLPYPYGSVIVMETASQQKDAQDNPVLDDKGKPRRGAVLGLHVMRREKGFGEAYGKNRTGEWEYVEYRGDKSFITPPSKSFSCAECHVKAGVEKDYVYQGRLGALPK